MLFAITKRYILSGVNEEVNIKAHQISDDLRVEQNVYFCSASLPRIIVPSCI